MNHARLLFSLLLLACLPGAFAPVAGAQDVIRKTLSVAPGGKVQVETDVGSVEVHASTGREVRVEVYREVDGSWGRLSAAEILRHFVVDVRQEGSAVVVEGRYRRDAQGQVAVQGGEMSRLQARVVVYAPADADLAVHTGAGAVQVADRAGDVQVQSGSGPITVGDVGGDVTAQTASGGITVGDVRGDAHLLTASGTVRTGRVGGRRSGTP